MAEFYILVKVHKGGTGVRMPEVTHRAHPHPKSGEGGNDSDAAYVASTEVCP